MKFNLKHMVTAAAFVLAFCLGASQAYAQTAKFSLPVEARWANIVLEPGEYTLEAPISAGAQVYYLRSNAGTKIVAPPVVDSQAMEGPGCLKLTNISGTYYIEEYDSPSKNMAIKFAVPKASRELSASTRVLVATN